MNFDFIYGRSCWANSLIPVHLACCLFLRLFLWLRSKSTFFSTSGIFLSPHGLYSTKLKSFQHLNTPVTCGIELHVLLSLFLIKFSKITAGRRFLLHLQSALISYPICFHNYFDLCFFRTRFLVPFTLILLFVLYASAPVRNPRQVFMSLDFKLSRFGPLFQPHTIP